MEIIMDELLKLKNYSYQDYLDIDINTKKRVELIDKNVYMMAGASAVHQDTLGNIAFILKSRIKDKDSKCHPRIAPYDLRKR